MQRLSQAACGPIEQRIKVETRSNFGVDHDPGTGERWPLLSYFASAWLLAIRFLSHGNLGGPGRSADLLKNV